MRGVKQGPLLAGLALWALLALPPLREFLEARLTTHVLVELLGLIIAGYWLAIGLRGFLDRLLLPYNRFGLTGFLVAITTGIVWMLPRWLDASLEDGWVALAKFMSLPLLLGLPLGLSWTHGGQIIRGFLKANFISMLGVLTWLYLVAPVRLCNNYLISDQTEFGMALGCIAVMLSIAWSVPLFWGEAELRDKNPHHSTIIREQNI